MPLIIIYYEIIEDGDLNSHPKEFISYVYYKMTISSYSRFLEDFDTNLHHLVEDGYLTYDHDPFDGYFTIYQTMGYHSVNYFSVDSLSIRRPKRDHRNSDNGYTIEYLGVDGRYFENRFIMNKVGDLGGHGWDLDLTGSNWDFNHIILILSLHLKDSLDRWDEGVRSGDGVILFENRNYCQDHLYILLNIEDIIKRMIDEKYIYDKEGVFHSKIEIETLRI